MAAVPCWRCGFFYQARKHQLRTPALHEKLISERGQCYGFTCTSATTAQLSDTSVIPLGGACIPTCDRQCLFGPPLPFWLIKGSLKIATCVLHMTLHM